MSRHRNMVSIHAIEPPVSQFAAHRLILDKREGAASDPYGLFGLGDLKKGVSAVGSVVQDAAASASTWAGDRIQDCARSSSCRGAAGTALIVAGTATGNLALVGLGVGTIVANDTFGCIGEGSRASCAVTTPSRRAIRCSKTRPADPRISPTPHRHRTDMAESENMRRSQG
jgi:hypothetical protein